jgi:uroporphyrinogen-III synthase
VQVVALYRSVPDGSGADLLRDALTARTVAAATFASASAVRGYIDAVGAELASVAPAVSIGPITSDALRDAGIPVAAEASEASIASLVLATRKLLEAKPERG